jgi:hypothetical protein
MIYYGAWYHISAKRQTSSRLSLAEYRILGHAIRRGDMGAGYLTKHGGAPPIPPPNTLTHGLRSTNPPFRAPIHLSTIPNSLISLTPNRLILARF